MPSTGDGSTGPACGPDSPVETRHELDVRNGPGPVRAGRRFVAEQVAALGAEAVVLACAEYAVLEVVPDLPED